MATRYAFPIEMLFANTWGHDHKIFRWQNKEKRVQVPDTTNASLNLRSYKTCMDDLKCAWIWNKKPGCIHFLIEATHCDFCHPRLLKSQATSVVVYHREEAKCILYTSVVLSVENDIPWRWRDINNSGPQITNRRFF